MEPFQNTITKEELMGYLRWAATQVSPPGQEKEIGASSGSGDGRAAGADSATVESDKRRPPPPPPSKRGGTWKPKQTGSP